MTINSIIPQSAVYPPGVTSHFQLLNYESTILAFKIPVYQEYTSTSLNEKRLSKDNNIDGGYLSSAKHKQRMIGVSPVPI